MSDDQTPTGDTQPAAAAGNSAGTPQFSVMPLIIIAQYVKDLSFENPNAPNTLRSGQKAPQVAIEARVATQPIEEHVVEVSLELRGKATSDESVVFIVEVTYAGLFSIQRIKPEERGLWLLIEAPRMLFPFARAVVADAVRDGGYPPLLINMIDFADLYRRQMAEAKSAAAANQTQAPAEG